jgi:hypothetical protein
VIFIPPGYHISIDADGRMVLISDADGTVSNIDPLTGQPFGNGTPLPGVNPNAPGAQPNQSPPANVGGMPNLTGGTAAFLPEAMKWLGALFLLWVILTALSEHGDPNAKRIGTALAGLILLGALFYLGPGAISNVTNLWTQTGTSSPVQGPNPVPGA